MPSMIGTVLMVDKVPYGT